MGKVSLNVLGEELLLQVLEYVSVEDLAHFAAVSQAMRKVSQSAVLWRHKYMQTFAPVTMRLLAVQQDVTEPYLQGAGSNALVPASASSAGGGAPRPPAPPTSLGVAPTEAAPAQPVGMLPGKTWRGGPVPSGGAATSSTTSMYSAASKPREHVVRDFEVDVGAGMLSSFLIAGTGVAHSIAAAAAHMAGYGSSVPSSVPPAADAEHGTDEGDRPVGLPARVAMSSGGTGPLLQHQQQQGDQYDEEQPRPTTHHEQQLAVVARQPRFTGASEATEFIDAYRRSLEVRARVAAVEIEEARIQAEIQRLNASRATWHHWFRVTSGLFPVACLGCCPFLFTLLLMLKLDGKLSANYMAVFSPLIILAVSLLVSALTFIWRALAKIEEHHGATVGLSMWYDFNKYAEPPLVFHDLFLGTTEHLFRGNKSRAIFNVFWIAVMAMLPLVVTVVAALKLDNVGALADTDWTLACTPLWLFHAMWLFMPVCQGGIEDLGDEGSEWGVFLLLQLGVIALPLLLWMLDEDGFASLKPWEILTPIYSLVGTGLLCMLVFVIWSIIDRDSDGWLAVPMFLTATPFMVTIILLSLEVSGVAHFSAVKYLSPVMLYTAVPLLFVCGAGTSYLCDHCS